VAARVQPQQAAQLAGGRWPETTEIEDLFATLFRTFEVDGEPAALFGVVLLWEGVGRGLALLSEESLRHPLALTRGARALVSEAFEVLGLRRLEITADTRHEAAFEWARVLGFEPEARMRYYGTDGADHWLLAATHERGARRGMGSAGRVDRDHDGRRRAREAAEQPPGR
jgi:hypothetical protein